MEMFVSWTLSPAGSWPDGGCNKDKSVKLISGVRLLESVQLQEVRSQACHEGGCCYWSNVIFYMDQRDQERGIGSDGVVHTMDLIAVLNH